MILVFLLLGLILYIVLTQQGVLRFEGFVSGEAAQETPQILTPQGVRAPAPIAPIAPMVQEAIRVPTQEAVRAPAPTQETARVLAPTQEAVRVPVPTGETPRPLVPTQGVRVPTQEAVRSPAPTQEVVRVPAPAVPGRDKWFCSSNFPAPLANINGAPACLSTDAQNCAWGYCDGDKLVDRAWPKTIDPVLCSGPNPQMWCQDAVKLLAGHEGKAERIDAQVSDIQGELSRLNGQLDRKGTLSDQEQQKIQSIAATVQTLDSAMHQEEAIVQLPTLAEEASVPSLSVDQHISLTQKVLDNHNQRLKGLEKYLCQIRAEMSSNRALLRDISGKLKDTLKSGNNYNMPDPTLTGQTIDTVSRCLKCPVCPMYERSNPVEVLDISKEKWAR